MTSINRIDASPATQAAAGITHYVIDDSGWKVFGANDTEIATYVASKGRNGKSLLRVDAHKQRVEIDYSIRRDEEHIIIDAAVNGTTCVVTFAKGGHLSGDGLKKAVDPALTEILHLIGSDLKALSDTPRRVHAELADSSYCGGLLDAIGAAGKAGENLAKEILFWRYFFAC
jgi:hypothetical protein